MSSQLNMSIQPVAENDFEHSIEALYNQIKRLDRASLLELGRVLIRDLEEQIGKVEAESVLAKPKEDLVRRLNAVWETIFGTASAGQGKDRTLPAITCRLFRNGKGRANPGEFYSAESIKANGGPCGHLRNLLKGGKINDDGYGRLACGFLVLMASAYRFNPPGRPTWKVLDDGRVSAFARTLLEVNPDSDMGKGFRAVQLAKSAAASTAVDVSASVGDGGDFDPRTRPQGVSSRDVESDVGSGVAEERSPPILSELWPNVILEGVPGTGKTHAYRERFLKAYRESVDCGAITFHAATAYEDFMEGLRPGMRQESNRERPVVSDSRIRGDSGGDWFFDPPRESLKSGSTGGMWSVHDGFFVTACIKAARAPTTPHFVLLDELNRANVPAVMGDLLTLLEPSKRAVWTDAGWEVVHCVHLAASRRRLFVPENLYVIGTMNTVDRSVASLDIALRRRFYIQRVAPMDGAALKSELSKLLSVKVAGLDDCIDAWADANKRLSVDLGENALLGHSYFFDALNVYLKAEARRPPDAGRFRLYLKTMFRYALLPQLVETLRALGVAGAVFTSGQDDQEDSEFSDLKKAVDKLAGLVGLGIHYNDRALDSYTIIDKK